MKYCFVALVLLAGSIPLLSASEMAPLNKLSSAEVQTRFSSDLRQIEVERAGLEGVIAFMDSRPDVFPSQTPPETRLLRREENRQEQINDHARQRTEDRDDAGDDVVQRAEKILPRDAVH